VSTAPISEEDMLAFVDGEMDAATSEAISAHLANFPQDAALVKDWRHQNELIRASFARIEHEPVPLSLSLKPPRNARTKSFIRLVSPATDETGAAHDDGSRVEIVKLALAVLLAFTGGVIAAILTPHVTNRVTRLVHELTSPAAEFSVTLQAMERALLTSDTPDASVPATSGSNFRIAAQDLSALGLTIRGFETANGAQKHNPCLLLSKAALPLTLCIEDTKDLAAPAETAFKISPAPPPSRSEAVSLGMVHAMKVFTVTWRESGARLALAGRVPEADLLDLARQISKRGDRVAAP